MIPSATPASRDPRLWAAIAAASLPSLLAFNLLPSSTVLNQALALALWGAFVWVSAPARPGRQSWPLLAALGCLALAATASWGLRGLPSTLALLAVGMLAAAALLVAAGAGARQRSDASELFAAFCWGWLVAGLLNVVLALIQVFLPGLADGDWIAASRLPGRAVGNLRQPNHLSSLLLWACVAVAALTEMRRLAPRWAVPAMAALIFAVVLTASRTGLVSVVLLALWGLVDKRLSRHVRGLLLAAPLMYAAAWFGMAQWAESTGQAFRGAQRLAETDISSSRFGIWANALALIRAQPWAGVGFGEFNFAWTLTPFPDRPVALFDNAHNLPLHLAAELGLPLAALVTGLLLWALWRGLRRDRTEPGDIGTAQRAAMVVVLMIGLHSLLEFPLWYAYFLLPAAWAWGFALPPRPQPEAPPTAPPARRRALAGSGLALVPVAALVVVDYLVVAAIFDDRLSTEPDVVRIARGQRSPLFAHHADYGAATSGLISPLPSNAFDRAPHALIDARLISAWARALHDRGDLDGARYLAGRLREFRRPEAAAVFAACPQAAVPPRPGLPFQCELPVHERSWRDFLPRDGWSPPAR